MYIFIFEDSTILKNDKYDPEDIISIKDGYLDIIDITNPLNPLIYSRTNDSWELLKNT